jgi:hypothetical protein
MNFLEGITAFIDMNFIPTGDKEQLMAGIEFYGGKVITDISLIFSCTHYITLSDKNPSSHCKIILPHYFNDCFLVKRRLPEDETYLFPNPLLLYASNNEKYVPLPVSLEKFLMNVKIFIDREIPMHTNYIKGIQSAGATLVDNPLNADYLVVDILGNSKCSNDFNSTTQRLVSVFWLADILHRREIVDPVLNIMHNPFGKVLLKKNNSLIICISNYVNHEREMIKCMISLIGGTFTSKLSPENTHLITCSSTGDKYKCAMEWNINIINHLWLEDCILNRRVECLTKEKYLLFRPGLQNIVGWLNGVYKSKKDNRVTESPPVIEEDEISPPSSPQIIDDEISSPPNNMDENCPKNDNKMDEDEEILVISSSPSSERKPINRASVLEITKTIGNNLTNINIVYNNRKRRIKSSLEENVGVRRKKSAFGKNISDLDGNNSGYYFRLDNRFRIMFTGFKPSPFQLKGLKMLNLEEASDIMECTHLVSRKICRTEKFLCAMGVSLFIIDESWLNASINAKKVLNEEDFLLCDSVGEDEFGFSLRESMERAKLRKLLQGFDIYSTPSVSPNTDIICKITEANGGRHFNVKNVKKIKDIPKRENCIILSNEEDKKFEREIKKSGRKCYSTELLLVGILKQELEFSKYIN